MLTSFAEDAREPFRYTTPDEVLGVFTDSLDRRFQSFSQGEQVKLIDAMRWEDKTLTQYTSKNRLAEWVRTTFETAQAEVENITEEATRAGISAVEAREPFPPFGRRSSTTAGVGNNTLFDSED